MRVFLGVELKKEEKDEIFLVAKKVESLAKKCSLTNKNNYHVTLQFIGNVKENEIEKIINCIKAVKRSVKPCVFTANLLSTFKNGKITVLTGDCLGLDKVHKLLHNELEKNGFIVEELFTPHVTLARKTEYEGELLRNLEHKIRLNCDNITLFHSFRDENGLVYQPIYKEEI